MSDNDTVIQARRALANAYSLLHSVESTQYLRNVSLNQVIAQAIRQLGEPGEEMLNGSVVPTDPPIGSSSYRSRLVKLRDEFKDQLAQIRALPAIKESDPELRDKEPDGQPLKQVWA